MERDAQEKLTANVKVIQAVAMLGKHFEEPTDMDHIGRIVSALREIESNPAEAALLKLLIDEDEQGCSMDEATYNHRHVSVLLWRRLEEEVFSDAELDRDALLAKARFILSFEANSGEWVRLRGDE